MKAIRICRSQVSRLRYVDTKGCVPEFNLCDRSINTQAGRFTNFNIKGGAFNDRISPNQALTVSGEEVIRRLVVGAKEVRSQHGMDPGNGIYSLVSPSGRISDLCN